MVGPVGPGTAVLSTTFTPLAARSNAPAMAQRLGCEHACAAGACESGKIKPANASVVAGMSLRCRRRLAFRPNVPGRRGRIQCL